MKRFICFSVLIFSSVVAFCFPIADSSFTESPIILHTSTGDISGTLTTPKKSAQVPVALIIAGSGPTDRNGNNSVMKNDCLMQLSHGLAEKDIASVRFDKRGIAASEAAGKKEADLRFENYIEDVTGWIGLLKKDKRFNRIIIIGHSEGSLIGMIAATVADGFVSIAGAGQSADMILKQQLAEQTQEVKDLCFPIIDSLKSGKTVSDVNPMLYSLFRPSVQPYMISWFKYDPQEEIKKLKIPLLILQGTNDIQVKEDDAKRLSIAAPAAKLILVENMNHVFKIVTGDKETNIKAYNNPTLPISAELLRSVVEFIKKS